MNLIFLSLLGVLGVGAIVDSLINNSNSSDDDGGSGSGSGPASSTTASNTAELNTITGTDGKNDILGSALGDNIDAKGGDDTVWR